MKPSEWVKSLTELEQDTLSAQLKYLKCLKGAARRKYEETLVRIWNMPEFDKQESSHDES